MTTIQWQDALAFFNSQLFNDVQMAGLFADSKTFADAIGKQPLGQICAAYQQRAAEPSFDRRRHLQAFVQQHFYLPSNPDLSAVKHESVDDYVKAMWHVLQRAPDSRQYDSLIPLHHQYLVPGGRFREIYYWDSYFTALGLMCDGHEALVVSMLENFLDIQAQVGCIPNGNRAYYYSRSQPPVMVLLFDLICDQLTPQQRQRAINGLEAEYQFWMQHRVVHLADGRVLNRYYDADDAPRPESYREDSLEVREISSHQASDFLRHIRAACESGWDFSSRWFADANDFSSIKTTDIVPVDLNALLYHLEVRLSQLIKDSSQQQVYRQAARQRQQALNDYCFDYQHGFYFDYDYKHERRTGVWSLAAVVPLFVQMAEPAQAAGVANHMIRFLRPGGLVTTLTKTRQQWDSPNGWAPLQWFAAEGLEHYGFSDLAHDIKTRWVALVHNYYDVNRAVLEKYDVCDINNLARGGEYEVQLGFGWTNGVYRAFKQGLVKKEDGAS